MRLVTKASEPGPSSQGPLAQSCRLLDAGNHIIDIIHSMDPAPTFSSCTPISTCLYAVNPARTRCSRIRCTFDASLSPLRTCVGTITTPHSNVLSFIISTASKVCNAPKPITTAASADPTRKKRSFHDVRWPTDRGEKLFMFSLNTNRAIENAKEVYSLI
jgi:hypothetical protein